MNNDEWTAFLSRLTDREREAVKIAQSHYFDDALKSYLRAGLELAGRIEVSISEQGAAVTDMRTEFRQVGETVSGLMIDVDGLKTKVAEHDREIASFRQSRDESIAERQELRADLTASKKDRIEIHKELRAASLERQAISDALKRIERELARHGVLATTADDGTQ